MRNLKALFVLIIFIFTNLTPPNGWAQVIASKASSPFVTAIGLMPSPGRSVSLSAGFDLAHFKGMVLDPNDPFKFDFIIHQGNEKLTDIQKRQEYTKLIKYFLAALAVPDTDQWVNLSPYEKNRIIANDFGQTAMGRDLLAQDYLLKQLSSSLTNPETGLGQKFWDQVYGRVYKEFGRRDIPLNTFNKVWIIPDRAVIYEKGSMMYVIESHLKVMTEEDYLAKKKHQQSQVLGEKGRAINISNEVMREVIIPAIEQEVNEGKNFAPLRQVLSGMLLATWYKRALKESILARLYANKDKLKGVDQDPKINEKIYEQYLKAYKKGVYNMIKEDTDPQTQEVIPRKYFSGGFFNALAFNNAMVTGPRNKAVEDFDQESSAMVTVSTEVTPPGDLTRMANAVRLNKQTKKGTKRSLKGKLATYAALTTAVVGLVTVPSSSVKGQSVTLAWNPSPSPRVAGYEIIVMKDGTNGIDYVDVGTNMFGTVTGDDVTPGDNYYRVLAYDDQGNESPPSNMVNANMPPIILPATNFPPTPVYASQAPQPQSFQINGIPEGSVVSSINTNNPSISNISISQSGTTATISYTAPNQFISNLTFTAYLNGTPSPYANYNFSVIPTFVNSSFGSGVQLVNVATQYGFSAADVALGILTVTAANPNLFAVQPYIDSSGNLRYVLNNVRGSTTVTIADTNPSNTQQAVVTINANLPPAVTFVPAAPTRIGSYQFVHLTIQATGGASNQLYNITVMGATNGLNFVPLGTIKVLGTGSVVWYDPSSAVMQSKFYSGVVTGLLPPVSPPLSMLERTKLMNMIKSLAVNKNNGGSINSPAVFFPNIGFKDVSSGVAVVMHKPGVLDNLGLASKTKDVQTAANRFAKKEGSSTANSPVFKIDFRTNPPTAVELANNRNTPRLSDIKLTGLNRNRGPFKNPRTYVPPKNFAGLNNRGKGRFNAAMTRGGIDFAQSNLDMQIRRDGKGMPLPMSQQNLDNIQIDGLVPVILDIKPVSTVTLFGEGSLLAAG